MGRGCVIDETVAIEAQHRRRRNLPARAPTCVRRTHLCEGAKAGTHVEIKKSTIGARQQGPAPQSYIGDTTMGEGVNIGAGSITCNYDGKKKWPTTIGDGVFVGSDTMMVAPVTIGDGAIIGAASCITKRGGARRARAHAPRAEGDPRLGRQETRPPGRRRQVNRVCHKPFAIRRAGWP